MIATALALFGACGGNSGNGGGSSSPPPAGGGTTTTNPCSTALLADRSEAVAPAPNVGKKDLVDGDPRGRVFEAMWLHQAAEEQRARGGRSDLTAGGASLTSPAPVSEDVGNIAVIQDSGDIVLPANGFDLRNTGIRFTPGGGGYSVSKIDGNFRSTLGQQLTLTDDDSSQNSVAFPFSFYGTPQTAAFVNSDGNITFGSEDKSSTERNVSRLLTGPPRIAPFLADLDPSTGGKVFLNAAADQYTVTWCAVRGFDSLRSVTVQATLLPDGAIELKYGDNNLTDAVIGLSPGRTGEFVTMDLSVPNPPSAGAVAMGERFAQAGSLDTIAVGRKFYASHGDNFDQLLMWSDQPLIRDAFAYETTVANEIRGIGQDIYDLSRNFGSGGRLRSVVVMDFLGKYPDDPTLKFLNENTTLSVMGQEVGHRWLAYVNFRDHNRQRSDALLGRDLAHWSFFFNSDASVMEGNEIEDQGGGQFRTVDAVRRYSRLDQYMMGLIGASQVPAFWYVENPVSPKARGDAPSIGVSFTGTRRNVLIDDVLAIHGARNPNVNDAPKTFRQAFLYIVTAGRTPDAGQVAKVDNFRRQWETFFRQATDGRMTPNTRLQ
jgi:hypothetical protein